MVQKKFKEGTKSGANIRIYAFVPQDQLLKTIHKTLVKNQEVIKHLISDNIRSKIVYETRNEERDLEMYCYEVTPQMREFIAKSNPKRSIYCEYCNIKNIKHPILGSFLEDETGKFYSHPEAKTAIIKALSLSNLNFYGVGYFRRPHPETGMIQEGIKMIFMR